MFCLTRTGLTRGEFLGLTLRQILRRLAALGRLAKLTMPRTPMSSGRAWRGPRRR